MQTRSDSTGRRGVAPLIAHVIYRLDFGGLENGVVNLVNRMPCDRFRHAVVCLTGATDFRRRITRPDVAVHCLDKPPGNDVATHVRLWRLLRALRPDIVHTRNLAALECQLAAALARCPVRVHGEHGRDIDDVDGSNRRRRWIRRVFKPFVHCYVTVSADLATYLGEAVGVPASRITRICNGVDTERFHPRAAGSARRQAAGAGQPFVIGTVVRMDPVKDPLALVRAFLLLRQLMPQRASSLRLAMAGDGALRARAAAMLEGAGAASAAWLPGACDDVPGFLRELDLFVLPSLAEGISNTVLEAMASGLPVVATRVGGNAELVQEGVTGALVPPGDPLTMARAISRYVMDREMARRHGAAARSLVEERFGLDAMVGGYMDLYEQALEGRPAALPVTGDAGADVKCAG